MVTDDRKDVAETWRRLEEMEFEVPRNADGSPYIPAKMPSYDDEEFGFEMFRTGLEGQDLSNLTLPRIFIGRSLLERVNLVNTDLTSSRMCWNDFVSCDFGSADLSNCDMRMSIFSGCSFAGANLTGTDLRGSTFEDCTFDKANFAGAAAEETNDVLKSAIDDVQRRGVTWSKDSGPEPKGG